MTTEKEAMDDLLATLTKEEERVIRLRIGIVDEEPGRCRSLSEIARELNVTRYRIRQIEAKALKKLRLPTPRETVTGRDKQWTMNFVLAGAAVRRLMDKGEIPAATKKLEELSSELDPETVKYLLHRIVDES